jgi:predicted TIM-barrel fold metal-dependent hydrolase
MWGSDYPHLDSTFPCSRQVLDEIMRDVSAADRYAMTRGNVARLYGLE